MQAVLIVWTGVSAERQEPLTGDEVEDLNRNRSALLLATADGSYPMVMSKGKGEREKSESAYSQVKAFLDVLQGRPFDIDAATKARTAIRVHTFRFDAVKLEKGLKFTQVDASSVTPHQVAKTGQEVSVTCAYSLCLVRVVWPLAIFQIKLEEYAEQCATRLSSVPSSPPAKQQRTDTTQHEVARGERVAMKQDMLNQFCNIPEHFFEKTRRELRGPIHNGLEVLQLRGSKDAWREIQDGEGNPLPNLWGLFHSGRKREGFHRCTNCGAFNHLEDINTFQHLDECPHKRGEHVQLHVGVAAPGPEQSSWAAVSAGGDAGVSGFVPCNLEGAQGGGYCTQLVRGGGVAEGDVEMDIVEDSHALCADTVQTQQVATASRFAMQGDSLRCHTPDGCPGSPAAQPLEVTPPRRRKRLRPLVEGDDAPAAIRRRPLSDEFTGIFKENIFNEAACMATTARGTADPTPEPEIEGPSTLRWGDDAPGEEDTDDDTEGAGVGNGVAEHSMGSTKGRSKGHEFVPSLEPLASEQTLLFIDRPTPPSTAPPRANTWKYLRCPAAKSGEECQLRLREHRVRWILHNDGVMKLEVPRLSCSARHSDPKKSFSVLLPSVWQQVKRLQSEGKLRITPAIEVVSRQIIVTRDAFMCAYICMLHLSQSVRVCTDYLMWGI